MADNDLSTIPTEQLLANLQSPGAPGLPVGAPAQTAPSQSGPDLSGASTEDLLRALPSSTPQPNAIGNRPQDTSMLGQLEHQGGLFLRGAVQAAAAIPGAVADAVTAPVNVALDAYDNLRAPTMSELVTGKQKGFRFQPTAQALGNVMDAAGVAKPQTATERVVQDVMQGVGGAAGGVGLGAALEASGGPFSQAVGRVLQQAPTMQMVSGATSGAAQGVAREEGATPLGQAVAGVAGAMTPSGLAYGAETAARGLLRGGNAGADQMQRNIDVFQQATGTTPSLGQATQRPAVQAAETGLASSLGGMGIMQRAGQRQLDAMDDAISTLAGQLSGRSTATDAGDAISQGIQRFKGDFRNTQKQLYSKLDDLIAPDTPVRVDATKQAMADLNADIAGAPALSQWFKNAKIQGLQEALESDTAGSPASVHVYPQPPAAGGGLMNAPIPQDPLQVAIPPGPPSNTLPYQALAKLRTLVGQEMTNNSLTSDIPRSKWSALYAALSDDLGTAAAEAGPDAQQTWQRANAYTRAGIQRLDMLDGIVSKDTPEAIYKAAIGASGDGGTRARVIMKSLPLAERRQVAAATLKRMGLAAPGAQDELGDVFSSERFLTAYNRMSPEARTAIFSGTGVPGLQQKVDELARVAAVRRDSGSAFANPSGTARLGALMAQASVLGAAIASGNLSNVALALGGFAVPAGLAKAVTSPSIVRWSAQPTQVSSGFVPSAAEAALRGASGGQQIQPTQQHLADGGEVFRGYPMAAKARRERGLKADIVPTEGGFMLQPTGFSDGGHIAAAKASQAAAIDAKAHQAATSPRNALPEPSEKQIAAGNYRLGHLRLHGMDVSIESPKGSTRRGVAPDGTAWTSQLAAHYGYVRRTTGNDDEHLDVFVGPHPESKMAFVIDQRTPDGKGFDEHKGALGFNSAKEAKAAYMASYSPGWKGFGGIAAMPVPVFRAWAQSGKLKQPLTLSERG